MMLVREAAPACQVTAVSPGGVRTRWATDEPDPSRVPSGLRWTTSIPGGADTLNCTLPRDPERAYDDLGLLTELQVSRNGGRAERYRLEETPTVSGDQMAVEPAARGYRAALEDRQDVRALYVDRDLSQWGAMSTTRRIYLLGLGITPNNPVTGVDPEGGLPGLELTSGGRWPTAGMYVIAMYDAGDGVEIGRIYSEWKDKGYGSGYAARFGVATSPDVDGSGFSPNTDLASGAASGTVSTTTTPGRYAMMDVAILSGVSDDVSRSFIHQKVAVYGDHGLTPQGSAPGGFYTGQMVEHLILNNTDLPVGKVADGTFLHAHAAYRDPATPLSILENLTRVEPLYDWMVYDGTFDFKRRGTYGKRWRARVADASLQSAGQSADRVFNEVSVRVNDPLLGTAIVGPTGAGYAYESASLRTTDPNNAANAAGIPRRYMLDIGEGTTDGAIAVGAYFLDEANRLDLSGQGQLVGWVQDDAGVTHSVDAVRAGDEIMFSDAVDTSFRRITATSFDLESRTASITLDSPAQTMEALLARLQAVLVPLN